MTDAGEEFYRHAVGMLRDAELAESAIRHRLTEPTGTLRCVGATLRVVRLNSRNPSRSLRAHGSYG
jgi:DNA-binding transcriptional LysR family regulator